MKALAVALASMALLAGCGGSGGGSSGQPDGSIKVTMTEFKFDPSTIPAAHGKVVFFLVNAGTAPHDMIVRDASGNRVNSGSSELVSAGDSKVFTIENLPAGTYTYFCDQAGHEAAGMHGMLTVT